MKQNRKMPAKLKRMLSVIKGRKRGLIVIYGNPDPDALGSAWALRRILRGAGISTNIAYTGEIGRPENQAMVEYLGIPVSPFDAESAARSDLVALVDAQPSFYPQGLLPRCDIVIDHHPVKGRGGTAFTDIRTACLATSSILTEYLHGAGCRIDRRMATALFYGIVTDARCRARGRTPADFLALEILENKIDRQVLRRIECSSYALSRLDYFAIAIMRLRHNHGALYANVGPVPSADVCAQIADFLIRVKESNWALVSGVVDNSLIVVFRCDGQHGDAGKTAAAAFGRFGSAGGHETMGRAEIQASALPGGMLLTQGERVERFVLERLAKVRRVFHPILKDMISPR